MSVFRSRPALRWLVPSAAAVAVIGGGAAAGTIVASADPALPERSAAQLLVDLQSADPEGFSGTVVQSTDLGLPGIAGLLKNVEGGGLTSLVSGSNTARVWYAGEEKVRLALLGTDGETDVIRNDSNVWIWKSSENSGTHVTLPKDATEKQAQEALPSGVPSTPQDAADAALAAIDETTAVATTGAAEVAGRDAYELVLSPRDTNSLVGQVRLAIDAVEHIPLRVDVYAKSASKPAVRVAFEQVSFEVPDAQQFAFNPPPNASIEEVKPPTEKELAEKPDAVKPEANTQGAGKHEAGKPGAESDAFKVIGEGWTTIISAKLPEDALAGAESSAKPAPSASSSSPLGDLQVEGLLETLPKVSGDWGSGRLLSGSLFSALITDDGRVFAGAVSPEALYAVA
ncbi:outer membrane lipoprotein-sorting protein [Actinoplanes lutulentus]|uniref:LolA family protein n=1 Tax=Actinoplanes lutulentus TaxID=1287878 RepID=UPI000DBA9FF7|nr:sigma-E factor regulatory protein RseB domain-containing protein [Actinoplanes lutulentus]MBB2943675.1 outer membrane lipoprotein-sorting protein [Actinoplanes lutulentus]